MSNLVENKNERNTIMKGDCSKSIEVMGKVKELVKLTKRYCTVRQASEYFGINLKTLESCIEDNKCELKENKGYVVVKGDKLKDIKRVVNKAYPLEGGDLVDKFSPSLGLFNRRGMLNIAMLLRDSEVAKEIRRSILNALDNPTVSGIIETRVGEELSKDDVFEKLQSEGLVINDNSSVSDLIGMNFVERSCEGIYNEVDMIVDGKVVVTLLVDKEDYTRVYAKLEAKTI